MIDDGQMKSLEAGPPRTPAGVARTGPALQAEGRRCDLLLPRNDDLLAVRVGADRLLLLLLLPPPPPPQ